MNKIKFLCGGILVILLFFLTIGLSYSIYKKSNVEDDVFSYNLDCLEIVENKIAFDGDVVHYEDDYGVNSEPHIVSVTNVCEETKNIEVRFNIFSSSTVSFSNLKVDAKGAIEFDNEYLSDFNNSASKKNDELSSSKIIGNLMIEPNETKRFNIRMWIDKELEDNYLYGKIEYSSEKTFIKPLVKTTLLASAGLNTIKDEDGISYYYSGKEVNNYLMFNNLLFRIIRINGDGSVRLIMQDSPLYGIFNSNKNDSKYLGMSYDKIDSVITTTLNTWFNTNMSGVSEYINDSSFCNDTTLVSSVDSYGVDYYSSNTRVKDSKPNYNCKVYKDKVGLLNIDEYMYSSDETGTYLSNGKTFYTSSPSKFYSNSGYMYAINMYGNITEYLLNTSLNIRPVINLISDISVSGTGTIEDPYTVDKME